MYSGPEIAHETNNGCNFGQFPSFFKKLSHVFARIVHFLSNGNVKMSICARLRSGFCLGFVCYDYDFTHNSVTDN